MTMKCVLAQQAGVHMEQVLSQDNDHPRLAEIWLPSVSYRITFRLLLAPLQQCVALGATIFPSQGCQRVSSFHTG